MQITRGAKPERDFAIISNSVLRDESLSFRARGVLCCILSHAEGYQLSSDRLKGKEGRDAIRKALDELEASGYLTRTKSQDEKGRWSSGATVHEYPIPTEKPAPTPDKPTPDKPTPDKPTPENPASVIRASVDQAIKEDQEENNKKKYEAQARKISFDGLKFENLSSEQVEVWKQAYPAVNVPGEILKAASWLNANPANAKSDYKRFLNNWLCRAQDKAPAQGYTHAQSYAAPVAPRPLPSRYQPAPPRYAAAGAAIFGNQNQNQNQNPDDWRTIDAQ